MQPLPNPFRTNAPLFGLSRKKISIVLGIFILLAGGSNSAQAGSAYSASLSINDASGDSWLLDLSNILSYNSSTGTLSMPTAGSPTTGNWSWTTINVFNSNTGQTETENALSWHTDQRNEDNSAWASTISFYGTGNTDPSLTYAFSARNTTNVVQNYNFVYGETIDPAVSGNYTLYSDVAGSVTNGVAGTTAKITPLAGDLDGDGVPEIQVLKLSADGGTTLFDAGTDVGPAFETGTAAGTSSYGVYSSQLSGSALSSLNFWQFETKFSLTPGRDAAAVSGFAELDPVEIPEFSYSAIILAFVAFGLVAANRWSALRIPLPS